MLNGGTYAVSINQSNANTSTVDFTQVIDYADSKFNSAVIGENGNWWIDGADTGIKAEHDNTVAVIAIVIGCVAILGQAITIICFAKKRK